jgi:bifunctional non-homologous end joining protein LigD
MVRDGRVRLYTIHGADWSKRYPLVTEAVSTIDGSAILDAEVVWIGSDGAANFDALHSRVNDQSAVALAFDLMSLDGEDFRQEPFSKRKAVLRKVLGGPVAAFSTWSTPKATEATCSRLSASLAWRICLKETRCALSHGPSKTWIKVKNPKAPAATLWPELVRKTIGG